MIADIFFIQTVEMGALTRDRNRMEANHYSTIADALEAALPGDSIGECLRLIVVADHGTSTASIFDHILLTRFHFVGTLTASFFDYILLTPFQFLFILPERTRRWALLGKRTRHDC
jgi:hypothetical protein